jgi:hypothetical protein
MQQYQQFECTALLPRLASSALENKSCKQSYCVPVRAVRQLEMRQVLATTAANCSMSAVLQAVTLQHASYNRYSCAHY